MPKKQIKVGSYLISRESKHVKIAHENNTFVIHIAANDQEADDFFTNVTVDGGKKYFELAFASMQVFDLLLIQNPQYMQAWLNFHNGYYSELAKELTTEEDQQIIDEEKALHGMGKDTETETETNKIKEDAAG